MSIQKKIKKKISIQKQKLKKKNFNTKKILRKKNLNTKKNFKKFDSTKFVICSNFSGERTATPMPIACRACTKW